jgi:hypothetical protein
MSIFNVVGQGPISQGLAGAAAGLSSGGIAGGISGGITGSIAGALNLAEELKKHLPILNLFEKRFERLEILLGNFVLSRRRSGRETDGLLWQSEQN